MHLFSKKADKKMAAYQKELIETHYRRLIICTARYAAGAMIIVTISRQ